MDFSQARQFYARLKQQVDLGQITVDEFERRVNEVVVTDQNGAEWQIGVSSGKWYRYDSQGWVEDLPTGIVEPAVVSAPGQKAPAEPRSKSFNWLWLGGGLAGLALVCSVALAVILFIYYQNKPLPDNIVVPMTAIATQQLPVLPQPTTQKMPVLPKPATKAPTASPGSKAGPGFDPKNPPFFDDFSNPASGWNRDRTDDYVMDYENGAYRIQIKKANWAFWANPKKNFEGDVIIEVDASKRAGSDKNGFGVICRYQDENNYYRFMISSDGLDVISKKQAGNWVNLSSDVWEPSAVIRQGAASNHIRAECIGDSLKLLVNDQLIASASDSSFTSGQVGLTASAYDTPDVDILFDNFSASSR